MKEEELPELHPLSKLLLQAQSVSYGHDRAHCSSNVVTKSSEQG